MIASGFGAILAVVVLAIALIGLLILAFYKWKLALTGLVALAACLFAPLAWTHITYALENAASPFDHTRYLAPSRTSDPSLLAGFGVMIPADAPFRKCDTGWHNDPRVCRWFEVPTEWSDRPVTFRIYALGNYVDLTAPLLSDRSICETERTVEGLDYIPPESCDWGAYWQYHVHLTPEGFEPQAVFVVDKYSERDAMAIVTFRHGPFRVSAHSVGLTMDQWQEPITRIIPILDTYFTVLPAPDA